MPRIKVTHDNKYLEAGSVMDAKLSVNELGDECWKGIHCSGEGSYAAEVPVRFCIVLGPINKQHATIPSNT